MYDVERPLPTDDTCLWCRHNYTILSLVFSGVCVHLFPAAALTQLPDFPTPELVRIPLDDICLQIKVLTSSTVHAFLQSAMDPPDTNAIDNAVQLLESIGAVTKVSNDPAPCNWVLTPLGKVLWEFVN